MMNRGRGVVRTLFGLATSIALLGSIGCSNHSSGGALKPHDTGTGLPKVEITAIDDEASESGDTGTFTITLSEPAASSFNVYYEESWKSTAFPDIDYQKLPGSALIAAGENSVDIIVIPIDDDDLDGVETVTIYLVHAPQGEAFQYAMGTNDEATIRIISDDAPQATVTTSTETISENGDIGSFTITLSEPMTNDVTITYQVMTKSSATSGVDYEALDGTATVRSGNRTVEIQVQPINDNLFESDETVSIMLLSYGLDYEVGYPNTATLTITSDELPAVDITAIRDTGTENGTRGIFQVSIAAPMSDDLVIDYDVSGGATNGIDYESLSASVVIPAGERTARIEIAPIHDDYDNEGTEFVTLELLNNASYNLGSSTEATVAINDYVVPIQLPIVTMHAIDPIADEDGDTGTIMISIDQSLPEDLMISIETVSGGDLIATSGVDYVELPKQVKILKGQTATTVTITPIKDNIEEPDEIVMVRILPESNYHVTTQTFDLNELFAGIVTITGTNGLPKVRLFSSDTIATEGGDSASFTVEIDRAQPTPISIFYSTEMLASSAIPGEDFQVLPGTIVIPAGKTSATQQLIALQDNIPEGVEKALIWLSPGHNYGYGVEFKETFLELKIISTETLPLATIEATDPIAHEHGLDTATFVIKLDRPASEELYINLNHGYIGSAEPGEDYYLDIPEPLIIPQGQTSLEIVVIPVDDTEREDVEEFGFLLAPGAGYTAGDYMTEGIAFGYIYSDEAPALISVTALDSIVSESGNTAGTFRVSMSESMEEDLILLCDYSGSASPGEDYMDPPRRITIPAGESYVDIEITVLDDDQPEPPESIRFSVREAATYRQYGNLTEMLINSDDDAPTATLVAINRIAEEGAKPAIYEVHLDRTATTDMTISFNIWANEAASVDDIDTSNMTSENSYVATGTVVIKKGDNSAEILINAVDDAQIESVERFEIELIEGPNYIAEPQTEEAIYITSNDQGPLASLIPIRTLATEGGKDAIFEIILNEPASTILEVNYEVYDYSDNWSNYVDYEELSGTATVRRGEESVQVRIRAIDDNQTEIPKSLYIRLLPGANYGITQTNRVTVTVESDE